MSKEGQILDGAYIHYSSHFGISESAFRENMSKPGKILPWWMKRAVTSRPLWVMGFAVPYMIVHFIHVRETRKRGSQKILCPIGNKGNQCFD